MSSDSYAAVSLKKGYLLHGHYQILDVVGRGGFSFTYKAQDKYLKRIVAVKEYFPTSAAARSGSSVMPIDAVSRDGYTKGMKSFIKEAQTLAKFRNEHICSVLDYFEENGTAYLIMPYIFGESLDKVLKKCPGGVMNSVAVRKWMMPLLGALRDLHQASYIHRDIKPSNIYITFEGEPILIDFGAARASVERTRGYTVVLTPEYAPPEQSTADAGAQGPWTDIYSFAAVAYRCLMGTPPPNAQKRIVAKANGRPDPLDEKLAALKAVADQGLYNFIKNGLVLPYEKRLQSALAVENILKNSPGTGQRAPVAPGLSSLPLKNIAAVAFVVFALICTVVGIYQGDPSGSVQAENSQQREQPVQHQGRQADYNSVQADLEEGLKNYNRGNLHQAAQNFSRCSADYDNPGNSQLLSGRQAICTYYLGIMSSGGQGGLPVDNKKSIALLTFSARKGYAPAMYDLAKKYEYGKGIGQDTRSAVHWYTQAAYKGNIEAAKALGAIYEGGLGNVQSDCRQALAWYKYAYSLDKTDKSIGYAIKRLEARQ